MDSTFGKILTVMLFIFFMGGIFAWSCQQREDCARRSCPEGMTPKVIYQQGCLCVTVPK